jgi:hypothetical protein
MAKAVVTGRAASVSTNRYWVLQNENEYVWNGYHWIRQTSDEAEGVVGFKLKKMAEAWRKHLQANRPEGHIEICRASYSLQIKIKSKPIDDGFRCAGEGDGNADGKNDET